MRISTYIFIIILFFCSKLFCQIDDSFIDFSKLIHDKRDLKTITPEINKWNLKKDLKVGISSLLFKDWNAGGNNNISINGEFFSISTYKEGNIVFSATSLIRFGTMWENLIDTNLRKFNKLEDRFELSASLSYISFDSEHWLYSSNISLRTQLEKGYPNRNKTTLHTSDLFAPAYVSFNIIGMEYNNEKNYDDLLYFYLSPISNKTTLVLDNTLSKKGSFGVEQGKYARTELGFFFENKFHTEIYNNIFLKSKLVLFGNYLKDFGNIDINWDLGISMKINKYFQFDISIEMIYDDDIKRTEKTIDGDTRILGASLQIRQRTALNFVYSF